MTRDEAHEIYQAINVVRTALPVAAMVIEAANPAAIPFVEAAKVVLGKLFEAISALESHPDPEAAVAAYRAKLSANWQAGLDGGQ